MVDRIDVARQQHIHTRMGKVLLCKQCQLFFIGRVRARPLSRLTLR